MPDFVLEIIISKFSCILKMTSKNTFPQPQPDSASLHTSPGPTLAYTTAPTLTPTSSAANDSMSAPPRDLAPTPASPKFLDPTPASPKFLDHTPSSHRALAFTPASPKALLLLQPIQQLLFLLQSMLLLLLLLPPLIKLSPLL